VQGLEFRLSYKKIVEIVCTVNVTEWNLDAIVAFPLDVDRVGTWTIGRVWLVSNFVFFKYKF
jgi:hypothetical protein